MKTLKGSKTEKNLITSFAGESQARNRYTYFASKAREEGLVQISMIFEETANQEKEHAKRFFKQLEGGDAEVSAAFPAGVIGSTADNLKAAAAGENHEWTSMYPQFLKEAREEGNDRAAKFFETILRIEKHHGKRYQVLLERLRNGTLYKSDKEEIWFCTNCGYMHRGKEAPQTCPNCAHPQGYFKRSSEIDYGKIEL